MENMKKNLQKRERNIYCFHRRLVCMFALPPITLQNKRASRRGTWTSSTWCQVLWTQRAEHLILLVNHLSLQLNHSLNCSTDRRLLVIDQSKANCIAGIIQVKGKANKLNIPVSRYRGSISDCNHTTVELTWPPSNKRSWIQYQNQLRAHPSRSKHNSMSTSWKHKRLKSVRNSKQVLRRD